MMNSSPAPAATYRNSFKAECDRRRKAGLLLTGNTYPYRESLGRDGLGGIWDSYEKGWLMPNRAAYDKAHALINRPKAPKAKTAAPKVEPAAVEAAPVYEFEPAPVYEPAPESGAIEGNDDMPF